jgi:hypothetical protein
MKELLNEWRKFLNEGYAYLDSDGNKQELPDEIIKYYLDTLGKQRLGTYLQYTNDGVPNFYDSYGPFDTVAQMVVRSLEVNKKIDYSQLGATYDLESVLVKYAKENQLHKKYDMLSGEGE